MKSTARTSNGWEFISSYGNPDDPRLLTLNRRMRSFYERSAPQQDYHRRSETANVGWDGPDHPLHRAVLERVQPNDVVVEFSCGTGFAHRYFAERGARYVGFDIAGPSPRHVSESGAALCIGDAYHSPLRDACADFTISFFALEHMVWPARYLEEAIRVTAPAGTIAIAFPDYVTNPARVMPSVRLGKSNGGLRYKLRRGHLVDAWQHWQQRRGPYAQQVKELRGRLYGSGALQFLINLQPACLYGNYESDNDALYVACEEEVARYLTAHGCSIELRSEHVRDQNGQSMAAGRSGNALVVARRAPR